MAKDNFVGIKAQMSSENDESSSHTPPFSPRADGSVGDVLVFLSHTRKHCVCQSTQLRTGTALPSGMAGYGLRMLLMASPSSKRTEFPMQSSHLCPSRPGRPAGRSRCEVPGGGRCTLRVSALHTGRVPVSPASCLRRDSCSTRGSQALVTIRSLEAQYLAGGGPWRGTLRVDVFYLFNRLRASPECITFCMVALQCASLFFVRVTVTL